MSYLTTATQEQEKHKKHMKLTANARDRSRSPAHTTSAGQPACGASQCDALQLELVISAQAVADTALQIAENAVDAAVEKGRAAIIDRAVLPDAEAAVQIAKARAATAEDAATDVFRQAKMYGEGGLDPSRPSAAAALASAAPPPSARPAPARSPARFPAPCGPSPAPSPPPQSLSHF